MIVKSLKLLTKRELNKLEKKLPKWAANSKKTSITRSYSFKSHVEALVFIARITVHAEVQQHHPDITFTYRKVKVKLTTHDLKGLSKKDIDLAKKIEDLFRG